MFNGLRVTAAFGIVAALVALRIASAAAAPQTLEFRLTPKTGDAFEMRLHRVRRSVRWEDYKGQVTEKQLEVGSVDVEIRYRVRVVSVNSAAVEVELEFTSSAGKTETRMGPYAWDSAKQTPLPTDWTEARNVVVLAALGGVKVSATLDASGRVVRTKGLREALAKALESVSMPKHVREQQPSDADLAAVVQSFLPAPPPGTWTVGTPRDEDGAATWGGDDRRFTVRRTLKPPTTEAATIEDIWTYRPPAYEEPVRSEVERDEGSGRGVSVWSRAHGWLQRRELSVEHKLATKFGGRLEAVLTEKFERVAVPSTPASGPK